MIIIIKMICWLILFWFIPANLINTIRGGRVPGINLFLVALSAVVLMLVYKLI